MKKKKQPIRVRNINVRTMQLDYALSIEESLSDHLFLTLIMKGGSL